MSAPLIVDGRLFGLINLDSSNDDVFDDTDKAQIILAINLFRSFEQIIYVSQHDT